MEEKDKFFEKLKEEDYGAYLNYPYTFPPFTMIGLFQRLFKIKSKYYKNYERI